MSSPNLNCLIGRVLESVAYRPLEYERDIEELARVPIYIGGEIVLQFSAHDPIHVSWYEYIEWPHHFSLRVAPASLVRPEAVISVDASAFPLWSARIGKALRGWRIWGIDDNPTPHVIELVFDDGSVFLGDGVEYSFGDGDDLIAADRLDEPVMFSWHVLAGSMSVSRRESN